MKLLFYISIFILSFSSCRKIEIVVPSEYELIGDGRMLILSECIW